MWEGRGAGQGVGVSGGGDTYTDGWVSGGIRHRTRERVEVTGVRQRGRGDGIVIKTTTKAMTTGVTLC